MARCITWCQDLARISALPYRDFQLPPEHVIQQKSRELRHAGADASAQLLPIQVAALYEAQAARGLIGMIGTGGGKTLLSGLLPTVFNAQTPMLIVPASLVAKTRRELATWARTWKVATNLYVTSYQALSRVSGKNILERHAPDLLIFDEAHRIKNRKAACTKRVARYLDGSPGIISCYLSGTLLKRGLGDVAHLSKWALRERSPLPHRGDIVEEWSAALGFGASFNPPLPGALSVFAGLPMGAPCDAETARAAFRRRILGSPGVVASTGETRLPTELRIKVVDQTHRIPPKVAGALEILRDKGERPDGVALLYPPQFWALRRELALGFFYAWSPPGPPEWLLMRKVWASEVRGILSHSRTLDSEAEVVAAVKTEKRFEGPTRDALLDWERIEPSFKPRSVPRWLDDSIIERIAEWARHNVGLIWVEHAAVGHALAKRLGTHYYGKDGVNSEGSPIEADPGGRSIVVGVDSNSDGRNLQHVWSLNLFPCPLGDGADRWEQAISRTFRQGQTRTVTAEIWILIPEHWNDLSKSIEQAHRVTVITGNPQKLLTADEFEGYDPQDVIDEMIDRELDAL